MMYSNTLQIPEMLTLNEVSERTGLSYNFLRNLCLQGKIAHIRTGNKYRINMTKFIEFLNTEGKEDHDDEDV